ncbi:uncharacterized protein AMSG_05761 [Thecamonas trahens ATCC 50062]|uniref:Uncharacterized protein n=1 Tax=Thecamonas trahens ATCC 50062 TaxID=461836 RepID=A0A0L0DCD5_THETB|nr:hypothetical protein AMSG_05761 [Thecamonas trahens ATCC 50062]KNC50004.1 hypothetical protein AMSG_05761 [Thecamonas trahens ATCC 50062]|eukprot:XP_013757173.1 hypothetical protein AMSG_05761 [Thecamonas trahens ATCC 50062]
MAAGEMVAFPGGLDVSNELPWAVLVAGEHHSIVGEGGTMGAHVSLAYIGRAYTTLRKLLPRDRIVVIAQAKETMAWLNKAASTGLPLFSPSMDEARSASRWAEREADMAEAVEMLMAEGGANYDGQDVNPQTVLNVLRGLEGGRSVLFAIYSHGWSHYVMEKDDPALSTLLATTPCDLCGDVHMPELTYNHEHSSTLTREFYAHMPYASPDDEAYGAVSHSHMPHALKYLYFQQLFETYAALIADRPNRPIVALYNFCGSGGMTKFLSRESYRRYHGVSTWPLYGMTSSGEMESSIVGLFPIWFELLDAAAREAALATTTLADLFKAVEATYLERNPELVWQEEIISTPCISCLQFQGKTRFKRLCSQCYVQYSEDPSRFDMRALRARAHGAGQVDRASDEVSSIAYNQQIHQVVANPTVADCSLDALFVP